MDHALLAPADPATASPASSRVHAEVSPLGAALLGVVGVLFGLEMAGLHHLAHAGAPELVPAPIAWPAYALAVAALLMLKFVAHEAGHVFAAVARGLRWCAWGIRRTGTPYVRASGRVRTNTDQLLISLSGPAADVAYAAVLFAVTAGLGLPGWSPVTVVAWLAVANAVAGVALPVKRGSDADRVIKCGWAFLTGRGPRPSVA